MDSASEEDIFRILLATDTHLGYGEANPIRENDSFVTFEEILTIANKEKVDFILLGGDLFHETRPSPYCINKCTELIRKYCLGDKPVEIEYLSTLESQSVNYEDPNLNVSIPIFSIHGNHDDPTGKRQVSAMDLMSTMGFINYFGRWDDVSHVEVNPILLKKGESRLALYGLSHIRDERLARLFLDRKVVMRKPEDVNDWFNLMVLHQNRANRGVKNFIADSFIPEFMDLVMWGHEHDCRIEPTPVIDGRGYITQPGSSVATSLAEGEAIPKKIGLLRINKRNFNITPIDLQTVRPFIFKTIELKAPEEDEIKIKHMDRAKGRVLMEIQEMINEAKNLGKIEGMLPLIRLVVKYHDERQVFNTIRFGQELSGKVANPEDVLKFASLQKKTRRVKAVLGDNDFDEVDDEQVTRPEDLISRFLQENKKLLVLPLEALCEATKRVIDSNDTEAPLLIVENQEQFLLDKLLEMEPEEDQIDEFLERLRETRAVNDFRNLLNDPNRPKASAADDDGVISIDDDDDAPSTSLDKTAKTPDTRGGKGARKGRGSRGPRTGRGRAK